MNDDLKWLRMALQEAKKSPDPRTQNGAVIVKYRSTHTSYIMGYNCFPVGIQPRHDIYLNDNSNKDREKLRDIEHAERMAIYSAAKSGFGLVGTTMYCPWFACIDCAKAIIESGIRRIVGSKKSRDITPERWLTEISRSDNLLKRAGVKIELLDEIAGVEIMFNSKKEII